MTPYAIGIDIGGTNIKAVAVSASGDCLEQTTHPTHDGATVNWAETIGSVLRQLQQTHDNPAAVGLSAPGLAARDARSIAWMQGRMEAVQGLDWTQYLQSENTVRVLNDAQAALLGEAWIGAAANCANVVLLTLGTGVGGGVLCDGRLLRGNLGRAGHLGHISLNADGAPDIVGTPGSLEDAMGDCTVEARSKGRFASTKDLVHAAQNGDAEAAQIWNRSVQHLAAGIVSLTNAVDPEVVIIGGGIARAGAALFDPLQTFLDRWEWRPTRQGVRIVPARLGEFAGAFGAARYALLFENEENS